MIELVLLSIGAFALGYTVSYLVMTLGIKQDKQLFSKRNKIGENMNNVNVPDEWPRHKKVKFFIVSVVLLALFLLLNIQILYAPVAKLVKAPNS